MHDWKDERLMIKRIFAHLKENWIRHGFETLAVLVGVLAAFTLNNWNEIRKERAEEQKILTEVRNALRTDLAGEFERHIQRAESDIADLGFLIDQVENDSPFADSMALKMGVLVRARIGWAPQLTAYKLLESRGLELIQSDTLIKRILEIYAQDYPLLETTMVNYQRNIYDYGRPIARRKLLLDYDGETFKGYFPLDYASLSQDVEFRNTLRVLLANNSTILRLLVESRGKVERVVRLIEEEVRE